MDENLAPVAVEVTRTDGTQEPRVITRVMTDGIKTKDGMP